MTHTTKKVQSIALELKRFEEITLQLEKHIETYLRVNHFPGFLFLSHLDL